MTPQEWRRARLGALIFRYLTRICRGDSDRRYIQRIRELRAAQEATR